MPFERAALRAPDKAEDFETLESSVRK